MMRTKIKILTVIVLLLSFFACGRKYKNVSLEKEGTEYKIADLASFYYPKDYELDTKSDNQQIVRFVKEEEVIFYTTISDDTDNQLDDLPELYAGQLEEDGAENVAFKNIQIKSGLNCQEFTGSYMSTGIKFEHMVYFTDTATYVLAYQAPEKFYDENIQVVNQFLESLTVHH